MGTSRPPHTTGATPMIRLGYDAPRAPLACAVQATETVTPAAGATSTRPAGPAAPAAGRGRASGAVSMLDGESPGGGPDPGHWEVTSLGPFRLRAGGLDRPLCTSRPGRAVLEFLLGVPDHAATPEALVERLWPAAVPAAGLHRLHTAVSALRRVLRGCGPGGGAAPALLRPADRSRAPLAALVVLRARPARGLEATGDRQGVGR
jgi:hypothetical protein